MSNIEKLYYNINKLSDDYKDLKETVDASDAVEDALGKENFLKYEDKICAYASASEKQDFIFGFQYAVSLMTNGKAGILA